MLICQNLTHVEWRMCLREYFLSQPFTPTEVALFTVAYGIITVAGLFGNGLVIYVVASKPKMRTARNVFITNLALSNFLLAAITIPFLWMPSYQAEFNHSVFFCKVATAFPGINIFCSTLTISVIAVDRYLMIASSRFNGNQMKVYMQISITICIWCVAFLLSLPYLLFQDVVPLMIPEEMASYNFGFPATALYHFCAFSPPCGSEHYTSAYSTCKERYELGVSLLLATFLYFVPLGVVFTFNFMLTNFLKNSEMSNMALRRRTTASYVEPPSGLLLDSRIDACANKPSLKQPLGSSPSPRPPVSATRAHSLSHTTRRRNRTTALLFAMAVSYALLWLPFIVLSLHIHLTNFQGSKTLDEAFKLVTLLSTCVNPLLYGFLNTNFNREFGNIFQNARRTLVNVTGVWRRTYAETMPPIPRSQSAAPMRNWKMDASPSTMDRRLSVQCPDEPCESNATLLTPMKNISVPDVTVLGKKQNIGTEDISEPGDDFV